jgi:hypothetical protein
MHTFIFSSWFRSCLSELLDEGLWSCFELCSCLEWPCFLSDDDFSDEVCLPELECWCWCWCWCSRDETLELLDRWVVSDADGNDFSRSVETWWLSLATAGDRWASHSPDRNFLCLWWCWSADSDTESEAVSDGSGLRLLYLICRLGSCPEMPKKDRCTSRKSSTKWMIVL